MENSKLEKIKQEEKRISEIFSGITETKKELAKGIIEQAAFISVENAELQEKLIQTGMVKFHPERADIQKPIAAAQAYRQNASTYNLLIKTLNQMLNTEDGEGEDPFDEWLKEQQRRKKD